VAVLHFKFRLASDELRAVKSQALCFKVARERAVQLEEHAQRKSQLKKENEFFAELWEQDRQKKIQREDADRLRKEQLNHDAITELQEQLNALKLQAQREKQLEVEEAELMLQERKRIELEDYRMRKIKIDEQIAMRRDIDKYDKIKSQNRQKEVRESLEQDMKILNEFMQAGKAEAEAKTKRKEHLKREMSMYRDHLEKARQTEKLRQEEMDKWYASEQDKVFLVSHSSGKLERINGKRKH
jgi:hypothetical protein